MALDDFIRVRIPRKLRARLTRVADRQYKTVAEASREALRAYVDRHDEPAAKEKAA